MSKGIAFFDFDGTITTKDTFLEFIKYTKGVPSFLFGFLLYSPYLVGLKLKVCPRQTAKEKVLTHFYKGWPVTAFQEQCDRFADEVIPRLIRPKAMEEIKRLKEAGSEIVIVSASPGNWIRKWADDRGIRLIATRLEIKDGRITGKLQGLNCHGPEKVKRIQECYSLADYTDIFAYGDTKGDLPMLQLANNPYYKPFRDV